MIISSKADARRTASFLAMGCVGFIATAPAFAQTADTRLQGVTVTDTVVEDDYRAEEIDSPKAVAPILDTPRIVNVVTSEVIDDTASFSFEEALRTVPGITLGAGEGGTAAADIPLIRGVDATSDTFVDGVRDVGSQNREIFAVERIEVFKGPSSTFGGRGTAAGAINIVSKMAREGDFAAATATVGTSDLVRLTADANAEIGGGFAVRVAGLFHDSTIAGSDEVADDRWGISPSITFGAGTETVLSLAYYHFETEGVPDYGIPLTSRGQLPGGVRVPADVDYDNFYGLLTRDFQDTRNDSLTFQASHNFGNGLILTNTSRYADTRMNYIVTNPDDSAGNVVDGLVWRAVKSRNSNTESFASNTNLGAVVETGSLTHSLAVGFEYSWADTFNRTYSVDTGDRTCPPSAIANFNCTSLQNPNPFDPWTGSITPSATPNTAEAEDFSVYAFDSITIVPEFIVSAGIRYTDYSAEGAGSSRGRPFDVSLETDFITWQAGAVYKPQPWASIYASYGNSKNPPGTDVGAGSGNIAVTNELFEPQETENYELGAKAELLGGALLLSGAIFQVDRNNIVSTDVLGDPVEVFDAARLRGFEIGASGRVGNLMLLAGYTFIDSDIRDGSVNEGNSLPNTPESNLALTATYAFGPQFEIGGGVYHASERFADAANLIRADGYVRVDLNASYEINDNLGLRFNLQNVGDERYISKLRNPHFGVPAAGRQALLSLTARY